MSNGCLWVSILQNSKLDSFKVVACAPHSMPKHLPKGGKENMGFGS
jgi:hypothetical protein